MEKHNRLIWLEQLRGIAIFLVVLGHITVTGQTPQWLLVQGNIIYSFHMPLFFIMSGFLFGYKEIERKPTTIVKNKLLALGIPYLIFSALYIVLNVVLQNFVSTNTVVRKDAILRVLFEPVAHYWFIYVLLIFFVIVSFLKEWKWLLGILATVSVVCYFGVQCGLFGNIPTVVMQLLTNACWFFGAVFLGLRYKQTDKADGKWSCVVAVVVSVVFVIHSLCFWNWGSEMGDVVRATNEFVLTLTGVVFAWTVSKMISRVVIGGKALKLLGERSWYIYLLHSYFLVLARLICSKLHLGNEAIQILIGLVFGCGGPLGVSYLCKKIGFFNFFFYPNKRK